MTTKYAVKLQTRMVREQDFPYNRETLGTTKDTLNFCRSLQDSDVEKFIVLHLNAQNVLNCVQVAVGSLNQAGIYPREVIKTSIVSCSCAMILVHNHPSGHLRPSESDIRMTKQIADVAKALDISVYDHIILGLDDAVFSFREEGLMP